MSKQILPSLSVNAIQRTISLLTALTYQYLDDKSLSKTALSGDSSGTPQARTIPA